MSFISKITILLLAGLLPFIAIAQEEEFDYKPYKDQDDIKTLFVKGTTVTGFGAFDIKISDIRNQTSLILGGSGGIILNHNFLVGLGGYGITSNVDFDGTITNETFTLNGGYGGLILGYHIKPKEIVHLSVPVILGAGGANVTSDSMKYLRENSYSLRYL